MALTPMQAQRYSFSRGSVWLREAFALYRKNPSLLTAAAMSYQMLIVICYLSVVLTAVLPVFWPILMVAYANVCRTVDGGAPPARDNLFAGIADSRAALTRLGFVLLAALTVLSVLMALLMPQLPDPEKPQVADLLVFMLAMLVVTLPLVLAMFAPLLTAWHQVPAGKSLFFSVVACLRNWKPLVAFAFLSSAVVFSVLLVFSVIAQLLSLAIGAAASMLAVLPMMLLVPTLMSLPYVAYRDIFHTPLDIEA